MLAGLSVSNLPQLQDISSNDKIIIDRDGFHLLDYDNLYITTDQISFNDEIVIDSLNVLSVSGFVSEKYQELVSELTEKSIDRSTAQLVDITQTISEGTLSSSNYKEFIISSQVPYSGPNNTVLFDDININKLNISIDENGGEANQCDVSRIIYSNGTISIPTGTYRVRASISLSPEIFLNLDQQTIDEYIARKQQIWSYLSFVQLTPPERVILNGSGSSTYNNIGQSITLNLNGYFYTDQTRQYCLKVHTLGRLYPGVVTGTYSQEVADDQVATKKLSISDFFGREQFNQSRFIIERISSTDTLSPQEDSPNGYRSQSLILQPRIPLVYNAGWLQRIDAEDNSVIPSTEKTTISALPFEFRSDLNQYIGDLRGYITEPKSYQGFIKVGDNIRYRIQQPDQEGNLNIGFSKYDIRDPDLKTLNPGWYGLIIDETKVIGDQYDTIFRVDKNGVISQRSYITDPNNYYSRCISGNTPPSTATPTITGSVPTTPTQNNPRGQISVVGGNTTSYTIPDNGPSYVHAVCIGGGEGGYRSKYNNSSGAYSAGRGGNGGDLVYRNYISVEPGDVLILRSGIGGPGRTWEGRSGTLGGHSELYIRKRGTSNNILLIRAAGGGRVGSTFGQSGTGGGRGGQGGLTQLIDRDPYTERVGGGGGAGGYRGDGGNGGNGNSPLNGRPGAGGGGGGGGSGTNALGGEGGGIGQFGVFNSGSGGSGTTIRPKQGTDGSPGSRGSNRSYGGGGPAIPSASNAIIGGNGGVGLVRVIWGNNRSFPNNAL